MVSQGAAAAGKSKAEIERLLAEWFPQLDAPEGLHPIPAPVVEHAPGHVETSADEHAPGHAGPPVPERSAPRQKVTPLSPQRFSLTLTMEQEMHDDLCYAQELLGHQVPSGDVARVLHRGLKALIAHLEKRKFGATDKPRPGLRRSNDNRRYVPAAVRRAVWRRDGGRCTFVSESGHRCAARGDLEFDHVEPVARGGEATVENLRLQCRAHNQYEAERAFGAEFMRRQRDEARRAKALQARGGAKARAAAREKAEEVIPYLRKLGVPADKARLAADQGANDPDSSLEGRVRAALSYLAPARPRRLGAAHAAGSGT